MNRLTPIGARIRILRGDYRGLLAEIIGHRPGFVAKYVVRLVYGSNRRPGETLLAATGDFELDPVACACCYGTGKDDNGFRCWPCNGNGLDPAHFFRTSA